MSGRVAQRWRRTLAALATVGLLGSSSVPMVGAAGGAALPLEGPQLSLPNLVWLPGRGGASGHLWVADGVQRFCRLDPTASGGLTLNVGTCDATAANPGQVILDPNTNADGTHYVFIADKSNTTTGAIRLTFDPAQERILAGSGIQLGDGSSVGLGATSLALGPIDGKLYLGFVRSGEIMRIDAPRSDPSAGLQWTELVGSSSDGRGVSGGLAFVGKDLYLGEAGGNGVTAIPDPSTCNPFGTVGGCQASLTAITAGFPGVLLNDNRWPDELFIGDAALGSAGSVVRYNVITAIQDTVSTTIPAYVSSFDGPHLRYSGVTGLAIGPNGELYVGDDPTLGAVAVVNGQGRVYKVACPPPSAPAAAGGCLDAAGRPNYPAPMAPPDSLAAPASLVSWGQTAPSSVAWLPGQLGGHYWVSDHTQGMCRLDAAPIPVGTQPLLTSAPTTCDKGGTLGSPGQIVYDAATNADGTHFVYVPDNAVKSPGLWRLTFSPVTETVTNPTLMAPGAGLDNVKLMGVVFGPDGSLYAASLKNSFIYRISNPRGPAGQQMVQVIGTTSDGRGVNGTIGLAGADLYLPENGGLTVIKNIANCGSNGLCTATRVNIPGLLFSMSVATDPRTANTVYVSTASGASNAIVYRYTPSTGAAVIYASQGVLPPATMPDGSMNTAAIEYCSMTCVRRPDPFTPFGGAVGFHFTIGMFVDPRNGNLLIGDDPLTGARGFHGHVWSVAYTP
jgi:hypothetical protein